MVQDYSGPILVLTFRPYADVSCGVQRVDIDKLARERYARRNELLVLNWRAEGAARSGLQLLIERV